ncbi:aldose 1-epimerase family protein [Cohnella nanjingensis]|uniref:Aldose 1-epimerase family protein n=1 Tax=Cohnella nanjingensis TaxID=1387779 RepID=A0A7X0RRM1_9BACL|nr:aldose 1-epimerase family protein [Cohnella nanjingensis]MBB6672261.1 aldose 1-epimerase family protein [Cohnella nanjingensis]
MRLYGRNWTRRELEARVGHIGQIGGVRRMTLTEGKEAGTEIVRVRTGAGLAFDAVPSKGLDISHTEIWGAPVSWQSPNGDVHPMYYEPEGAGWLRTASGGLLMTCGLTHVGSPSEDASGSYGLHGRAHHTPARHVCLREEWIGDELEWSVSGMVEETSVFGSQLRLTREISGRLGENRILIQDRVENVGFRPAPHMMLYHFNFGFPLLGEQTVIKLPFADSEARDTHAPLSRCSTWETPRAGVSESVYYHHLRTEAKSSDGMAEASLHNPVFPAGGTTHPVTVKLRWSADTLPILVQWRMPGAGEHVLGLEPSNCKVEGRAVESERGGPLMLEPGATVSYKLELNVF